ncbi:MAG: hypothetical protein NW224_14135 [Leptolyngbyaceae cyanobacterium bins.302]|nr:hypothetical protein [Leptolyngbyaceae cyanobacterium bins.302]
MSAQKGLLMGQRIPETYTVFIARTGKEPKVFLVSPIALWIPVASLVTLILVSFLLGWFLGQSSTKRSSLQMPFVQSNNIQST